MLPVPDDDQDDELEGGEERKKPTNPGGGHGQGGAHGGGQGGGGSQGQGQRWSINLGPELGAQVKAAEEAASPGGDWKEAAKAKFAAMYPGGGTGGGDGDTGGDGDAVEPEVG